MRWGGNNGGGIDGLVRQIYVHQGKLPAAAEVVVESSGGDGHSEAEGVGSEHNYFNGVGLTGRFSLRGGAGYYIRPQRDAVCDSPGCEILSAPTGRDSRRAKWFRRRRTDAARRGRLFRARRGSAAPRLRRKAIGPSRVPPTCGPAHRVVARVEQFPVARFPDRCDRSTRAGGPRCRAAAKAGLDGWEAQSSQQFSCIEHASRDVARNCAPGAG